MGSKKPSIRKLDKQREQISEIISGLSIFSELKDGVNVVNDQYDILFANKVLENIFGPWEGRKCYEYFESNTEVCDGCPGPAVFEGKTIWKEWNCSRNGRTYELIDSPLHNADGSVNKVEVLRDITGRKRAEEALRRSEATYSALIEQATDGVFITQDGVLKFINEACAAMVGYSVEEMTGRPFPDVIAPEYRAVIGERYQAELNGEDVPSPFEVKAICKDGTLKEAEFSSTLFDYEGKPAVMGIVRDITKRKQAEEALARSQNDIVIRSRVASILMTVPDEAMYGEIIDVILEATGSSHGVFGYIDEKGDLVCPSMTRDIWDKCQVPDKAVVFPRETWGGIWGRSLVERKTLYSNEPLHVPEGHIAIARVVNVPIIYRGDVMGNLMAGNKPTDYLREDIGLLEAIAGYLAPILHARLQRERHETERRQAEERLGYQANLLQNVSDAIVATDKDLKITSWNKAAETIYGFTEAEVLGRRVGEVTRIEYSKEDSTFTLVRFLEEGGWQGEVMQRRKDNTRIHVYASVTAMKSETGEFVGAVGVHRDITRSKRAEDALRESEEKYRLVAENIPVMVYSALPDEHSTNLFTSGWVVELTGYSAKEFMDDPELFGNLIHPDDREYVWQQVEVLRREKKTVDLEYRIVVRDGSIKWVRDRTTSIVDKSGETTRINGFMEDITQRKIAEEALRESREQLQCYSEELEAMVENRTAQIHELQKQRVESEKLAATGRMAAKIAHEINNPLAGIKNSFLLVKDIAEKEHPHYAYVGRIESEIDRIAVVVRRMFDLYSPDRKEPREVAIGEVLADVVLLLESSCRLRDIKLEPSVPDDPVIAVLPVGYVNQILFNIVGNAIDASEPGGTVNINLTTEDAVATVTVTNRGRGIPEEIADRIFEPFFTTKDGAERRGLGLGLSITKSMVEASGGSVSFESSPSEGTVFTVILPLRPAA